MNVETNTWEAPWTEVIYQRFIGVVYKDEDEDDALLQLFFAEHPECARALNVIMVTSVKAEVFGMPSDDHSSYGRNVVYADYSGYSSARIATSPLGLLCLAEKGPRAVNYLLSMGADPSFPASRSVDGQKRFMYYSPIDLAVLTYGHEAFILLHKLGQRPSPHLVPSMISPINIPEGFYYFRYLTSIERDRLVYPIRHIYLRLMNYDAEWFWSISFPPNFPNWLFFLIEEYFGMGVAGMDILFELFLFSGRIHLQARNTAQRNLFEQMIYMWRYPRTNDGFCLYLLFIHPQFSVNIPEMVLLMDRTEWKYTRYYVDPHIYRDENGNFPSVLDLLTLWSEDRKRYGEIFTIQDIVSAKLLPRIGTRALIAKLDLDIIRRLQEYVVDVKNTPILRVVCYLRLMDIQGTETKPMQYVLNGILFPAEENEEEEEEDEDL